MRLFTGGYHNFVSRMSKRQKSKIPTTGGFLILFGSARVFGVDACLRLDTFVHDVPGPSPSCM